MAPLHSDVAFTQTPLAVPVAAGGRWNCREPHATTQTRSVVVVGAACWKGAPAPHDDTRVHTPPDPGSTPPAAVAAAYSSAPQCAAQPRSVLAVAAVVWYGVGPEHTVVWAHTPADDPGGLAGTAYSVGGQAALHRRSLVVVTGAIWYPAPQGVVGVHTPPPCPASGAGTGPS